MAKELERDLGLYAVITISVGAMIGSGIFVLPGLAATIAGPSVVLAYLLAGILVLPAALSKAEMATALPEAGGTYLYIDRAMGPLMGTVAGIGVWFSLVFKSAFALVGLGAYLVLFAALPTKAVALGLGVAIILLNIFGVKQTGQLQAILVTVVLLVLLGFIARGVLNIDLANFRPMFPHGSVGLLEATGFVYVSYAGVTKIASVAEEVEDPGRNIPIGILVSVGLMMLVYTAIVTVIVGVISPEELGKTLTPMSDAGAVFLGTAGFTVISITAVLALTGMANAGVLSSSRYPLAMSRDKLAPESLKRISTKTRTPVFAILLTGGLLLALIATVNVAKLAKLASAFKILVFILINAALIALREGSAEWYEPEWRSPLYPWVQFFGIIGGIVLLTQMGTLPMVGGFGLVLLGLAWYQFYGRKRTVREGAATDAIRRQADRGAVQRTASVLGDGGAYKVLIPVHHRIPRDREALLLRIGADIARERGGTLEVVRFEDVPDQTGLPSAVEQRTEADVVFEEQSRELAASLAVPVEIGEVVSHDTKRAVVNYAKHEGVDLILADAEASSRWPSLFGSHLGWLIRKAPCDLILVKRNDGLGETIGEVDVISNHGPFDPAKVQAANAIASETGAPIRFLHAVEESAPETRVRSISDYHTELGELCTVPTTSRVLRTADPVGAFAEACGNADLVVLEAAEDRLFRTGTMSELPRRIAEEVGASVLLVYPRDRRRRTLLGRLRARFLYR